MRVGRFLLATVDGGGTVPPELGLAAALVRRGHAVHVLSDPTVQSSAVAAGCGFTAWPTAPSVADIDEQTTQMRLFEHGAPWRRVAAVRDRVLVAPAAQFAADVVAAAAAQASDVVLAEGVPGILVGALATGLPVALLMPNIYFRPTPGAPPMGTGWSPGTGVLTRARNTLVGIGFNRLMNTCLPAVNRAATVSGVPPVRAVFDLFDRCARVLVMTSRSFDFVPARLPANVRYTGPQLDDPDWARWQQPADVPGPGVDPMVLVAMSSIFQDQLGVLRRAGQALGALPVRGLITTGRAIDPAEVHAPGNVLVVQTAPHAEVLNQAGVVITHAGHGTVLKSLAAGVPLVCVPQGRDQKDNAARVVRLGAGVRVGKRASAAVIAAAVSEVLNHDHYRRAAVRFAAQLSTESLSTPSAADEAVGLLMPDRP